MLTKHIRIPFTPGLIPRQRERIAKNLSKTIGDLISDDKIIHQQVASKKFIRSITYLGIIKWRQLRKDKKNTLIKNINQEKSTNIITDISSNILLKAGESIYKNKIILGKFIKESKLFTDKNGEGYLEIEKSLVKIINQEETKNQIKYIISKSLSINNKETLGTILGHKTSNTLREQAIKYGSGIIYSTINEIDTPQTMNKITDEIRSWARSWIEEQNTIWKTVLKTARIDEKIATELPGKIISTIKVYAEDPQKQSPIHLALHHIIDRILETPPRTVLYSFFNNQNDSQNEDIEEKIATLALNFLSKPSISTEIAKGISSNLEKDEHTQEIIHSIGKWLIKNHTELGNTLAKKLLQWIKHEPVGTILNAIPIHQRTLHYILENGLGAISNKAATAISSAIKFIDVPGIIEKKISQLSHEELERLVLASIKNNLRPLHILGGVLGILIGLVNAIVTFYLY